MAPRGQTPAQKTLPNRSAKIRGRRKKAMAVNGMTYVASNNVSETFCMAPMAQIQPSRMKPKYTKEKTDKNNRPLRDLFLMAKWAARRSASNNKVTSAIPHQGESAPGVEVGGNW